MCIPVRDENDPLAALMLAQALDDGFIHAFSMPHGRLEDAVETAIRENPDIVFLTGLPPFGFARAHRIFAASVPAHPKSASWSVSGTTR